MGSSIFPLAVDGCAFCGYGELNLSQVGWTRVRCILMCASFQNFDVEFGVCCTTAQEAEPDGEYIENSAHRSTFKKIASLTGPLNLNRIRK